MAEGQAGEDNVQDSKQVQDEEERESEEWNELQKLLDFQADDDSIIRVFELIGHAEDARDDGVFLQLEYLRIVPTNWETDVELLREHRDLLRTWLRPTHLVVESGRLCDDHGCVQEFLRHVVALFPTISGLHLVLWTMHPAWPDIASSLDAGATLRTLTLKCSDGNQHEYLAPLTRALLTRTPILRHLGVIEHYGKHRQLTKVIDVLRDRALAPQLRSVELTCLRARRDVQYCDQANAVLASMLSARSTLLLAVRLTCWSEPAMADVLHAVKQCRRLRSLALHRCSYEGSNLASCLRQLQQLQQLDLHASPVAPKLLAAPVLEGVSQLKQLSLREAIVADGALYGLANALANCLPQLQHLDLTGTCADQDELGKLLQALQCRKQLRFLRLGGTTSNGAAEIGMYRVMAGMPELDSLPMPTTIAGAAEMVRCVFPPPAQGLHKSPGLNLTSILLPLTQDMLPNITAALPLMHRLSDARFEFLQLASGHAAALYDLCLASLANKPELRVLMLRPRTTPDKEVARRLGNAMLTGLISGLACESTAAQLTELHVINIAADAMTLQALLWLLQRRSDEFTRLELGTPDFAIALPWFGEDMSFTCEWNWQDIQAASLDPGRVVPAARAATLLELSATVLLDLLEPLSLAASNAIMGCVPVDVQIVALLQRMRRCRLCGMFTVSTRVGRLVYKVVPFVFGGTGRHFETIECCLCVQSASGYESESFFSRMYLPL